MPRRKQLSMDESFDARKLLRETAEQGRLPWSSGVRAIRKSLGMTQARFAQAFDLTPRQVSELETGAANPTVGTLERLAKPLGLTVGLIPRPKPDLGPVGDPPGPPGDRES